LRNFTICISAFVKRYPDECSIMTNESSGAYIYTLVLQIVILLVCSSLLKTDNIEISLRQGLSIKRKQNVTKLQETWYH